MVVAVRLRDREADRHRIEERRIGGLGAELAGVGQPVEITVVRGGRANALRLTPVDVGRASR